jgi:hypothetical protein
VDEQNLSENQTEATEQNFLHQRAFHPMPTPTVAGSLPNTLKNENGAALMAPLESLVVIQAMGRGSTVASNSLYRSGGDISLKSNCTGYSQACR